MVLVHSKLYSSSSLSWCYFQLPSLCSIALA